MIQRIMRSGSRAALLTLCAFLLANTFQPSTSAQTAATQDNRFDQAAWGNRGRAAISQLGRRLPAIAARYKTTPEALTRELQRDGNLWIDREEQLVYLDEYVPQDVPFSKDLQATVPYAQTFLLHSLPGATKVIYLDFDGHTTKGTPWNSSFTGGNDIVSAPYEADYPASPGFSNSELDKIQYIWQRVAEDYAPFGVDVTTEDPGEEALRNYGGTDQNWGIRVVISPTNWYSAGAGGVAYLGSFTWNMDAPCWVFTNQLGNGYDKYVAEAVSHEVGHTLGLYHDGKTDGTAYYQGHGTEPMGWAPIMGVGYYYTITQWSKGEYPLANQLQDDIAVMTGNYGISLRNDDHGGTTSTATALTVINNTAVSGTGIIERATDKDYFSFNTGGGQVTLNVTGGPRGSNLDIKADLLNASGTLVTSNNGAGLDASLTATLAAGTYYLVIDGVGLGTLSTGYSDYGSLGAYNISGTIVASINGQAPVASIAASGTSGLAPLTVNFSSAGSTDSDGTIASYAWNFGNGASSTQANASAVYTTAGVYTVVLTVTDNDGLTGTASLAITVVSVPNAPSGLTATVASSTQINLAWADNSNNETAFQLDRSTDNATWTPIGTLAANVTSFSNTGLTAATAYYYRLRASNATGNSAYATVNATTTSTPTYTDYLAASDMPLVGTVAGTYTSTASNNAAAETITEVLSSGTTTTRYSYLEHKWRFNLLTNYGVTFYANAWQTVTAEADNFQFSYSTDNITFTPMFTVSVTADGTAYQSYVLPAGLTGPVYIRVIDTNRVGGKIALDKIMVDHLYIRGNNVAPAIPAAPTTLAATAASTTQINLSWTDPASNESGFQVERSLNGSTWTLIGTTAPNITAGSSTGLASNTTYYYRVRAFNLGGTSAYSNIASAKTLTPPPTPLLHVGNIDATATRNSTGQWNTSVIITAHNESHVALANVVVTGTWSNGATGTVKCTTNSTGRCTIALSNIASTSTSATYTINSLALTGYVYTPTANHDADGTSNGNFILIRKP